MNEAPDHPMIVKMERDGFIEVPEPLYDVYDTLIMEGETYFENEHGEAISRHNLLKYLAEENIIEEKTR